MNVGTLYSSAARTTALDSIGGNSFDSTIPGLLQQAIVAVGNNGGGGGGGSTAWGAITGKPANVTAFGDLANAAGVLANNGSGTLSYTAASTGGNGAADSGKIPLFDSGGGITSTGFTSQVNDLSMNLQSTGVLLSDTSSSATLDMRVAYLEFVSAAGNAVTTLYPSATVGTRALYFPAAAGTLVSTGDTGTVTDAMLAGSITPSKVTGTAAILGANTFTAAQTIGAGTLATAALSLSQTWNSVGTTCRGFDVAITDTNSAAASTAFRILTGAAGATQVCSVDKDGMPTFRVTTGHFLKMYGGVGSGIGFAGEFSTGGIRSGIGFNCGDGFAPLIQAVNGTTCIFGAGGTFGSPASLSPNFMGIAHSSSVATMTFGAVDKDYNGAFTGAGHNCVFRGGRGTTQGTGSAGGSASLRGGNARGGGNNNGGNVIIQGGDPTGSGTRGQISILNLPTSSAGLSTGMIWNDAGTLKVA